MPEESDASEKTTLQETFGNTLHQLISQRGWEAKNLAETIHVSSSTVSRWLNSTLPPTDKLITLANIFEVTLDYLLPLKVSRHTEKTDEFEWEWRMPEQKYIPEDEYKEISKGVDCFNRIMLGDDDKLWNENDTVVTSAILSALRSGFIRLINVPRQEDHEKKLRDIFPSIKEVFVAATPSRWARTPQNMPGRRIVKTEFVAFTAARNVLTSYEMRHGEVGIGVGMTVLRMCELSIPGSTRFTKTTWVALATDHDADNKSFTNHSANGIAAFMFNSHPYSSVRYAAYSRPPEQNSKIESDDPTPWDNLNSAFISVIPLPEKGNKTNWENYLVFAEKPPELLRMMVEHMRSVNLTKELAGNVLGHMIDRNGNEIDIKYPELTDRIYGITLGKLKTKAAENCSIYLLSAGRHKIDATRAILNKGYCNCLVIDDTIAQGLLKI